MDFIELVEKTRSFRRYDESYKVSKKELLELVNFARLGASARNQQSLKYIVINDCHLNDQVFPLLNWAGYLKDWDGPQEGERPTAYIIVLNDKTISENHFCDDGIAMQNIMLGSTTLQLGACMIASFNKLKLKQLLKLPDSFDLLYVMSIGKPSETVVLEEMETKDFKYWRDKDQVHHVPKRPLDEVIYEVD